MASFHPPSLGTRGRELSGIVPSSKKSTPHGPTVVVYPDAVWYGGVTDADIPEIIESHLVGGVPVERLRLADACINAVRCPHKPRPKPAQSPEAV